MSLPLVSAGGSGLVITCAALGLLYSVSRHEHLAELEPEPVKQPEEPRWDINSTDLAGAL